MSSLNDKFTFHGKLYEVEPDGTLVKLIRADSITSGNGINVINNGDSVSIESDLGLTVKNGKLCVKYEA